MRKGTQVFEGPIETLRRFKDDVKEVRAGYECGINIKGCNDYQEGDILECYQIEKKKTLTSLIKRHFICFSIIVTLII